MPSYNKALTFKGDSLSDFEASIQLNHRKPDERTLITTIDGIDLYLLGYTTVQTPDGTFLSGDELSDIDAPEDELMRFLDGEDMASMEGYTVTSNPWFEWEEPNNEMYSEPFSDIPADIRELSPE